MSRHGRHTSMQGSRKLTPKFLYKRQNRRAVLCSYLGVFEVNTTIFKLILVYYLPGTEPIYPAQSRPTWYRADLPGTEPIYPAQSRPTWHRAYLPATEPTYLAQTRPTWYRADLPGTEPIYLAQSQPTWHRAGLLGREPAVAV